MAKERLNGKVRKDKKGRALLKGEYQYPNGRYEYTYTDEDGNKDKIYSWCLTQTDKPPKGKECSECLRVAEQRVAKEIADHINSKKARKLTLDTHFEDFMQTKTGIKPTTRSSYIYNYNKYISPVLGSKKITAIRNSDIIKFYQYLFNDLGMAPNSVTRINAVLHPLLNQAVDDDIILKNPVNGALKKVKSNNDWDKSKRHALTEEEQTAFIDYVANSRIYSKWLPLFTTLLGTGLRIGEAIGLRWEDVNFDDNYIDVNHNIYYLFDAESHTAKYIVNTPKTRNSIRKIPMLTEVRDVLMKEYDRQVAEGFNTSQIVSDDGVVYEHFVFCGRFNQVLKPVCVDRVINRVVNNYNSEEAERAEKEGREPLVIRHFSAHSLRHTFCTRFCLHETNLKVIQEIMGHSNITTTMDIYNEATMRDKKQSLEALEGKVKLC